MTAGEGGAPGAASGTPGGVEGTGGTGAPGGAQPPDDPQALVEDIERTREELGNTVEALTAKLDVKARATERAAEMSGQVRERLTGVKDEVAGRLGQVTSELTGKAALTRRSVSENGKTVLGAGQPAARQLTARAATARASAWNAAPEPVQRSAQRVVRLVDEHRVEAVLIAGAILVAGGLTIYWMRQP